MKNTISRRLVIAVVLGLLAALVTNCKKANESAGPVLVVPSDDLNVAAQRKEIIARNVLAAQLAAHDGFEGRTSFAPTEAIPASLYLTDSSYVEPRNISAFLMREEVVVEEESIYVSAADQRRAFDFRFIKSPRPTGAYQIKFVEIARSKGKPVLLARLFLKVE
jgi:hypothetical protein